MATLYAGTESAVRMDTLNIGTWLTGSVGSSTPSAMFVNGPGGSYRQFSGLGFAYGATGIFAAGTVTSIYISDGSGGEPWGVTGFAMPVATLKAYVAAGNTNGFLAAVFAGNDSLNGHNFFAFNDDLNGYGGHDTINGGAGNDSLHGGSGNDSLIGGPGNGTDDLDGGAGADKMQGGNGSDYYTINNAGDVVIEASGLAAGEDDAVYSTISHTLAANVEHLELAFVATAVNGAGNGLANSISGNGLANKLYGYDNDDTLSGGNGNDSLYGGAHADLLLGGNGNDIYYADSSDTIDETVGSGTDLIIASTAFSLNTTFGEVENLTLLAGAGAIDGQGNWLANKITGNESANNLSGYDGNDTLLGGNGNDSLNGGSGDDAMNGGIGNDTIEGGHGVNTINVVDGNDTVRHQPSLDAYDIIQNFDGNAAGGQDVFSLDAMFDALGVSVLSRDSRVQLTDKGANVDVRVDTNGDGTFDYLAATLYTANTVTIGQDVLTGS